MIDARRRHDGVCGVRPGAGAYGAFLFLLLDEKEPKNQGRHHRTHRTKRALPRHVGRSPRTQPGGGRSPGWKRGGVILRGFCFLYNFAIYNEHRAFIKKQITLIV